MLDVISGGFGIFVALVWVFWPRKRQRPITLDSAYMSHAWMKDHIYRTGASGSPD